MKTKLTLILCVVLALCLVAGCGEAKEAPAAKITGVYLSPASYEYNNMRPDYNFYLLSYAQSEVTLYDNNTYEVIVSASTFSGIELSESTNDATANERTNSITKFFGTYTSKTNDLDDDLLDVTLAKPTRIVKSFDQRYWLDTANWTETMGKYVIPAETDPTTGAAIAGTGDPWTAQQYLDANAFAETTIQVNVKTSSFDYSDFGVHTGFYRLTNDDEENQSLAGPDLPSDCDLLPDELWYGAGVHERRGCKPLPRYPAPDADRHR